MAEQPQLSRYNFLRLAGGGLVGLALDEVVRLLRGDRGLWQVVVDPNVRENLERAGLGELAAVYGLAQGMEAKFGATIFPELINLLKGPAGHGLPVQTTEVLEPGEIFRALRADDWGSRIDRGPEDAQEKVRRMVRHHLTLEQGVSVIPQAVESFLGHLATIFPGPIMAMPDTLIIGEGGGYAGSDETRLSWNASKEVTFLHEIVGHQIDNIDNWPRMHEHVDKDKLLDLVAAYFIVVDWLASTWLALPEDTAFMGRHSFPFELYGVNHQAEVRQQLVDKAREYARVFLPTAASRQLRNLDEDSVNDWFMRCVYYGYHQWHEGRQFISAEARLFSQMMTDALWQFHHYLVGPVQKPGGGLAIAVHEVEDNWITPFNMIMQAIRFDAVGVDLGPTTSLRQAWERIMGLYSYLAPTSESVESVANLREVIENFGGRMIGRRELYVGLPFTVFELTDNPQAPELKPLYIHFDYPLSAYSTLRDVINVTEGLQGMVVMVERGVYDPSLEDRSLSSPAAIDENISQVLFSLEVSRNEFIYLGIDTGHALRIRCTRSECDLTSEFITGEPRERSTNDGGVGIQADAVALSGDIRVERLTTLRGGETTPVRTGEHYFGPVLWYYEDGEMRYFAWDKLSDYEDVSFISFPSEDRSFVLARRGARGEVAFLAEGSLDFDVTRFIRAIERGSQYGEYLVVSEVHGPVLRLRLRPGAIREFENLQENLYRYWSDSYFVRVYQPLTVDGGRIVDLLYYSLVFEGESWNSQFHDTKEFKLESIEWVEERD